MLPIKYTLLLISIYFLATSSFTNVCKESLLVCYGKINPVNIKGYDVVILEESWYSKKDVQLLKKNNKKVICYISVGEVNKNATYFNKLSKYVYEENTNWDSYYLDLTNKKIIKILEKLISEKFNKGFDGLFLDNVDTFSKYGKYPNQKDIYVNLLKKIKFTYPNSYLIQNAGLDILPLSNTYIDSIAIESVISNYNFKTNTYSIRAPKDILIRSQEINSISKKYNKNVLLIEYANSKENYQKIKTKIINKNWNCFVGQIELQNIPKY